MSEKLSKMPQELAEALNRLFEGDKEAASAWLTKQCPALGFQKPIDVVNGSPRGSKRVLAVVTRLEYGVHQ